MAYCNNLGEALLSRNVEMVTHYLNIETIEMTDNKRWEILLEAIKSGKEEILDVVSKKIDITKCDNRNVTAMHLAACCGHANIVDYLFRLQKFDVNATDTNGMTALHYACYWGSSDIALMLLQAGADFRIVNRAGNTPGKLAEIKGHEQLAKNMTEYENYYHRVMQAQQNPVMEEEIILSAQLESPAANNVDNSSITYASRASRPLEINDNAVLAGEQSSINRSNEMNACCSNRDEKYFDSNKFSNMEAHLMNLKLMAVEQMKMLNDIQAQIKGTKHCTLHQLSDDNAGNCNFCHVCSCSIALTQLTEAQTYLSEIIKEHTELLQQMHDMLGTENGHSSTNNLENIPTAQTTYVAIEHQQSSCQASANPNFLPTNDSSVGAATIYRK